MTGAADDDPSAVGTYASAGATIGPSFLWVAPAVFPMMYVVVYLSAKLGQVSGRGLFGVIRAHYPRWVLHPLLALVLFGNTFEAAADLGGMAEALRLVLPVEVPAPLLAVAIAAAILALQVFGSYRLIRTVFRWLALALCAYIASALLARPALREVLLGTLVPSIRLDREFLIIFVAVLGATLSAYLYTWQSNVEVEEEIEAGRTTLAQRRGATEEELRHTRRDIAIGTGFSTLTMYFIILATATTLFRAGHTQLESAAQAAEALRPLAGEAAGMLFALGIIAVGFLAVPIMTAGAAYDLCQAVGWKHGLYARCRSAPRFYAVITGFTAIAVAVNFSGWNPMHALVWAGVVQGLSIPPLLIVILLATSDRRVMGAQVNGRALQIAGWIVVGVTLAAAIALAVVLAM